MNKLPSGASQSYLSVQINPATHDISKSDSKSPQKHISVGTGSLSLCLSVCLTGFLLECPLITGLHQSTRSMGAEQLLCSMVHFKAT